MFLHQNGHKEPQNCNFQLVDANCDDSVTIPRCPNLVVDLKVSVALEEKKKKRSWFMNPVERVDSKL